MPYIDENERKELDNAIMNLAESIKNNLSGLNNPHDFSNYLGRINYAFSRTIMLIMGDISYKKIAMTTGVLENIKQEFYRRAAATYENKKINENGDIREYKLIS